MPPPANSKVSYAKITLPYPIFAADFDPYNRGYLVVGGGGGESKTGVPNQIVSTSLSCMVTRGHSKHLLQTVLDVYDRSTIATAAEIDLSRGEDSVQSLGNLATKDGLITFAGINSSVASQHDGKNEHLRSFEVKFPPRKKLKTTEVEKDGIGSINIVGKTSLFASPTTAEKETYQRLLRLSPAQMRDSGSKRIGAIATGMARNSELVVFDATTATPGKADILTRISLDTTEATDLDITEVTPSEFSLSYCTDYDIYEQTYQYEFATKRTVKTPQGPRRIHQMPHPEATEKPGSRPKFRALRFLNSQNVIALLNRPGKAGVELRIYHLYPTGPAIQTLKKSLPSRVKQAVSMDVCVLDADEQGNQQFIVAVAGQDISIEVYTTEYKSVTDTFSSFRSYLTLRDVHEHQMTKICFSPFHSPVRATGSGETRKHPGPQYTRLASVSYGNTVVVDTFPLSPLDPQKKHSRYVLTLPGDYMTTMLTYGFVISMIVLVTAFLLQSFIGGFSNTDSGIFGLLPKGAREFLDAPAGAANLWGKNPEYTIITAADDTVETASSTVAEVGASISSVASGVAQTLTSTLAALEDNASSSVDGIQKSAFSALGEMEEMKDTFTSAAADVVPTNIPGAPQLQNLVNEHLLSSTFESGMPPKAVVVRSHPEFEDELAINVHGDKEAYLLQDKTAKHWDELEEHQRVAWKQRLIKTGQWVEGQGSAVLKGVLFSEYAGLVGQVVGEALRG
nr:hypothetical protein CFP56_34720 [Quercus suber]